VNSFTKCKQETQLSLTNRVMHLCKCSDVALADLTSVINIRLEKNLIPRIRPFKVTQCHWNRHGSIRHLWFPISVLQQLCPQDIWLQKCRDLEIRVRVPSRLLDMSPFDRAHVTSYDVLY